MSSISDCPLHPRFTVNLPIHFSASCCKNLYVLRHSDFLRGNSTPFFGEFISFSRPPLRRESVPYRGRVTLQLHPARSEMETPDVQRGGYHVTLQRARPLRRQLLQHHVYEILPPA